MSILSRFGWTGCAAISLAAVLSSLGAYSLLAQVPGAQVITNPVGTEYFPVASNTVSAVMQLNTVKTFVQSGGTPGPGIFSSVTGSANPFPIAGVNAAQGGAVTVTGGTSSTSANAGGASSLIGGTPGATGIGGTANVTGGAGGSTSGAGGAATITGGAATAGNTAGGAVTVTGGAANGTGTGGAINVTGGVSGAGATGTGGAVNITSGASLATNGGGGAVNILGGVGNGTGTGGAVAVTGGASTGGATGPGGAVTIAGGASGATNDAGGAVSLTGGAGAGSGNGGAASLVGGAAGSTGAGGAVSITAGSPTAGNGSGVTITASAGAGSTNGGGTINLVEGAAVSTGAPGQIQVNGDGGLVCGTYYFTGTPAATNQTFYLATRALYIVEVSEVHSVAAGATSTLGVYHDTGTNAPAAGTDVLGTDFNLNATANTVQTGSLTATVATKKLAAGDRLSVKFADAIGSSAGITVTACMTPQ